MSDLISRKALIKVVEADINRCYALRIDGVGALSHFIDQIKEQPTVEAKPVVHGEWLIKEDESCFATWDYCSVCGFTMGFAGSSHYANFCPNCGADMRKKVQE